MNLFCDYTSVFFSPWNATFALGFAHVTPQSQPSNREQKRTNLTRNRSRGDAD